jgi:hypothetical protein
MDVGEHGPRIAGRRYLGINITRFSSTIWLPEGIEPGTKINHIDLGNLRRWGIAKRVVWPGEARATRFFIAVLPR